MFEDEINCVTAPSSLVTNMGLLPALCILSHVTKTYIWLKIMRMHIGLKICNFLLLNITITEVRKKIMRKTGIYVLFPYRGSTVKQFLFYRVSRKSAKPVIFEAPYS